MRFVKYKNISFNLSFFNAWITWVKDASHVTKRTEGKKIRAKCAAKIIHGARSAGGRRQNIWDSLIPPHILLFSSTSSTGHKRLSCVFPCRSEPHSVCFFSWYSAAVPLSFFNLCFPLQAPSAAHVKGLNLANCCLFLFCALEFNTNNAWGQNEGGDCSTAFFFFLQQDTWGRMVWNRCKCESGVEF